MRKTVAGKTSLEGVQGRFPAKTLIFTGLIALLCAVTGLLKKKKRGKRL